MLLHPSFMVFFISLVFSVTMVVSANSWFMAWLAMEINLISFVPLMLKKKNKLSSEASLKYFLIQAVASVFIISTSCLMQVLSSFSFFVILSSLLLKMGSAPLHQWVPSMTEGLSWRLLFILFTIQKLNPLVLVFFLSSTFNLFLIFSVLSSCLIGSIGGLFQSSLRKIAAYSSISHLSWILSASMTQKLTWVLYFLLYSFILLSLFVILDSNEMFYLNQVMMKANKSIFFLTSFSLLSLGGLPPFSGFLPKFIVSVELIKESSFFLVTPLLAGTFISLFFYIRILLLNLLVSSSMSVSQVKKNLQGEKSNYLNLIMLLTPSLGFIFI